LSIVSAGAGFVKHCQVPAFKPALRGYEEPRNQPHNLP
jgi:hypothetical protein